MSSRALSKLCGGILTVSLILTGCTIAPPEISGGGDATRDTSTVTLTSSLGSGITEDPTFVSPEPIQGAEPANLADISSQLQTAVDQAIAQYGGTAGIAFSDGSTEVTAGDMGPAPSWSTIKVPLAIAALRQDPAQASNATAAIQWSDNVAADALWASLGSPDQAGIATGAIMSEGASPVPVNTVVTQSGFSPFGQTMWATDDQARFAANLACISGSGPVVESMAMVEPGQSWGIGQLPGAQFKGGWGPNPAGAYTVRQFGLTTEPQTGQTRALAIIVNPGSGSFDDGQSMASTLISHARAVIPQAPATSC